MNNFNQALTLKNLLKEEGFNISVEKMSNILNKNKGIQTYPKKARNQDPVANKLKDLPPWFDSITIKKYSLWWNDDENHLGKRFHNLSENGDLFNSTNFDHNTMNNFWLYEEISGRYLYKKDFGYVYIPQLDVFVNSVNSNFNFMTKELKEYYNEPLSVKTLNNNIRKYYRCFISLINCFNHPDIDLKLRKKLLKRDWELNGVDNWPVRFALIFMSPPEFRYNLFKLAKKDKDWRIRTHYFLQKYQNNINKYQMNNVLGFEHLNKFNNELFYKEVEKELKGMKDPDFNKILGLLKLNIDMIQNPKNRKISRADLF